MGITERRQRQKDEVRTSIINAARTLVLEEGWQSLSIRRIAEAIEYSVPVIYDHFENKDAILTEFTMTGYDMLAKSLKQAKSQSDQPCQQLDAMANAYWNFAFENKEYYQLMFGLGMPNCESARSIPGLAEFGELLITSIKEVIASSPNQDKDPFLKYHTFWSVLHGLVSINMMHKTTTHGNMNELILKDAISSFIKALKE
ncbi:MAG: TetR/AcrR family transcriptional regulator [Flavipsychrobacter sp.]|nr:TetR/AcrR family transcriptional regulator [Flavipsychrobacter sp.]